VALGPDDNVYVSDVASLAGDRIAVLSKSGTFVGSIGVGTVEFPQDLAVGGDGSIYVIDGGIGVERFNKLRNDGTRVYSIEGPADNPFESLIGIALENPSSTTETRIYLTDYRTRTIYIYSSSGDYIDQWHLTADLGYPDYVTPGHVAVDWEGFVYVQMSDTVAKIDPSGPRVQEVVDITLLPTADFSTIDVNKIIYAVDANPTHNFVKTFVPTDTEELLVYVPAGAVTGPIAVTRLDPAGDETVRSRDDFTVLTEDTPVTIEEIEITQGLATYSFIAGKETLVWADLDGLFGHPTRDRAELSITSPSGIVTTHEASHFIHNFDRRYSSTEVHFHVPSRDIDDAGSYRFEVTFQRDGSTIDTPWVQEPGFDGTKGVELVFVKFTDVINGLWNIEDPFPWFNMRDFLYGISTFQRAFPVHPHEVSVHFVEGKYLDYIVDRVQYTSLDGGLSDIDRLVVDTRQALNNFESDGCHDCIQRCIGLLDPTLMTGRYLAFAPFNQPVAVTPFTHDIDGGRSHNWGSTLSHELGHTLGLVPEGNANHDPSDPNHHSINDLLYNEDGLPFQIWSSVLDRFIPAGTAAPMMFYAGGGNDDLYFFENHYDGEEVDYPFLIRKFRNEARSASSTIALTQSVRTPGGPKIVIVGGIKQEKIVTVQESYVTTADIPLTPVEASEYSLVFLSASDAVLAQDPFAAAFELMDVAETQTEILNLVRPLPAGTAKIEIRWAGEVLTTIAASPNPPILGGVSIDLSASMPTISWTATDADDDHLSFTLMYSPDGGAHYQPIAAGLTDSPYVWDHRLTGGTSEGRVKLIVTDGYHRAEAESGLFSLPQKAPLLAILQPNMDDAFTQGSLINLRGAAFDPEDGLLRDASLKWQMDRSVDFGAGETLAVQHKTRPIPTGGVVAMPFEVGEHTLQLAAEDSEGNISLAEIRITITADRDRDGFSDTDEEAAGSDPNDPFTRPQRTPVADPNGPYTAHEGTSILFDGSGSSDPDGDPLIYRWDLGDGTIDFGRLALHAYGDNGNYSVSLTVSDPEGLSGTASTSATITNVAPKVTMGPLAQPNPQFILPAVHDLRFTAQFSDPGWMDTHTAIWDFGDGTNDAGTLNEENTAPDATGEAMANHIYATPGNYTVTVTLTDDDGASDTDTLSVTVVDEFGALQDLDLYIQGLSVNAFKHPANQRKKTLGQKIHAVEQMLMADNYMGAIQKLSNDLQTKCDDQLGGHPKNKKNDWIIDIEAQEEICRKIEDLIAYLEKLLP
jgi:hypothetical protein